MSLLNGGVDGIFHGLQEPQEPLRDGQETGRVIQLGDEVRIRVKAVDLFKHKMDFELLADTLPSKKSKQKKRLY